MNEIEEILDMLDWNKTQEVQKGGIAFAQKIEDIGSFIQPLTPQYNKNVWENCAIIIAQRSDEVIKPYLIELLEWLQDMNWPGAFCILTRLSNYRDKSSLINAINICIAKANRCNDKEWKNNLESIIYK